MLSLWSNDSTAKYGVLTLLASIALPVISPLSLMPFAVSSRIGKRPLRSLRSVGSAPWYQITARQSTKFASHEVQDYLATFVDSVGFTVYMFWCATF